MATIIHMGAGLHPLVCSAFPWVSCGVCKEKMFPGDPVVSRSTRSGCLIYSVCQKCWEAGK